MLRIYIFKPAPDPRTLPGYYHSLAVMPFRKKSLAVVPYLTLSERIARVMLAVRSCVRAIDLYSQAVDRQTVMTNEFISELRRLHGATEEAIAD